MIRISTVQLSVIPGNIRANFEQMEREIQNARMTFSTFRINFRQGT